ncbi:MAG: hypothetical protein R2829_12745 [Bacteroidia bacterium]
MSRLAPTAPTPAERELRIATCHQVRFQVNTSKAVATTCSAVTSTCDLGTV